MTQKYVIKKVKTWNGVKYAVQTEFTHYPVVYDSKGNMETVDKKLKPRKKGEEPRSIKVPKIKEETTFITAEYREVVGEVNGKKIYGTKVALFENNSAGLEESKKVRDKLNAKADKLRTKS